MSLTCECRYLPAVPSGTSGSDAMRAVNRVLSDINDAGTSYFGEEIGGIRIKDVRAALVSRAFKTHMTWGTLLSAALSVVLMLTI